MWLCFNEGFLSIVDKDVASDCLLVRARRAGDIERYFPDSKVKRTPGNDYLYRASVSRDKIAKVITEQVMTLTYSNFKDSVADDRLHGAYGRVWSIMSGLQPIPPYSRGRRGQGSLL